MACSYKPVGAQLQFAGWRRARTQSPDKSRLQKTKAAYHGTGLLQSMKPRFSQTDASTKCIDIGLGCLSANIACIQFEINVLHLTSFITGSLRLRAAAPNCER